MSQSILNVIGGLFEPYAFETITVSSSAVKLTASKYTPTQPLDLREAQYVIITCETQNVRYTIDGTVPVASTTGHVLASGASLVLGGITAIRNFQAIRDTGSDGTIQVTYER